MHRMMIAVGTCAMGLLAATASWSQERKSEADPTLELFPPQQDEHPILAAKNLMADVALDLSKYATGKPTQVKQEEIVKKLDKLIEELEKECESCRGASTSRPLRHAADSQIMGGPGGVGDLRDAKRSEKKWAKLPPIERDRILQSMTEGFPAQYREVLERYYRRLADEKTATDGSLPVEKPAISVPDPKSADSAKTPEKSGKPKTSPKSAGNK